MAALAFPTGLGTMGTAQALTCPGGAQLATVCGAVDTVIATACTNPLPPIPTIGFITLDVQGGALLVCPDL